MRFAALHLTHSFAQRFPLDSAELLLAALSKISAMETPWALLDVFVNIGERPTQFVSQQAADGRFARSHETDQIEAGRALQLQ